MLPFAYVGWFVYMKRENWRVVLCGRSGKDSERVQGPLRATLASVPGFLLEDTV